MGGERDRAYQRNIVCVCRETERYVEEGWKGKTSQIGDQGRGKTSEGHGQV